MKTTRFTPQEAEAVTRDIHHDDPDVVAVIVCYKDDGEVIGYYEQQRDGWFYCVVVNNDIATPDELEAQAFLVEHMEGDCVTDEERGNGPRR